MKRTATHIIQRVGAHVGFIAVLLALLLCAPGRGLACTQRSQVDPSGRATLKNFMNDPDIQSFRKNLQVRSRRLHRAQVLKGAFIFGVEGGNGVLLARENRCMELTGIL